MEHDNSTKKLSILCWNAQSIHNKLTETFSYLNEKKIDIALFSETWLNQNHTTTNDEYTTYRHDRMDRNGGGVAISIRNHVQHELLPLINTKVIETIGIRVYGPSCNLVFIAAYFPGTNLTKAKLELFRKDIRKLTNIRESFFICGDFNSKHRFWNCNRANQAGNILFDEMSKNQFLINFPSSPTYFPTQRLRTIPSTIDIVLSNGLNTINNLKSEQALSSDHLPISFEIDHNTNTEAIKKVPCFSKTNWTQFKRHLIESVCLVNNDLSTSDKIDLSIDAFVSKIKNALDESVPLIDVRTNDIVIPSNIKSLITLRNHLRRQWQRSRDSSLKETVKFLNKNISHSIQEVKNEKFNKRLEAFTLGSKQFWKATKLLKNQTKIIPPLKISNTDYVFSETDKANEIGSTFFKAHHITLLNKSDKSTEINVKSSNNLINFLHPNVGEINIPNYGELIKILKNLKSNKCPGDDNISNLVIKQLPKKAVMLILQIFRACFRICYFPKAWKHAKIISIHKPGKDAALATSYRPISLLSSFSKILEKLIQNRLTTIIHSKSVYLNEQFGFRASHSTSHQLLRASNYIKKNLCVKKSVGMITFDVEKAFDSVWHAGLLFKMKKFNFPIYLIHFIRSFIEKRSFHVSINNTKSTSFNIPAGVPQGSVLSPILFNIFTSDIELPLNGCELALFADDTAIYTSSKHPQKIIDKLTESTNYLSSYCKTWKIQLNSAKTQAAYFTRRRSPRWLPQDNLNINGNSIVWTNEIKYLGVLLDKSLTFKRQTEFAAERALKYIKILYPLINRKSKLNVANKILLYKSIFQSILLYGSPVWGDCAMCHRKRLQTVQNKCLKIILKKPRSFSTIKLHSICKVPLINDQIAKINSSFNYKLNMNTNRLIRELCV